MLYKDDISKKIGNLITRNTDGYDVVDFRLGTAIGTVLLLLIPVINYLFKDLIPDNSTFRNILIVVQLTSIVASYRMPIFKIWANEIGNTFSLIYSLYITTIAYTHQFDLKEALYAMITTFALMGMFRRRRSLFWFFILSSLYFFTLLLLTNRDYDTKYFIVFTSFMLFSVGYYIFSLKIKTVSEFKKREEASGQREVWFRSIFDNAPVGIVLYDAALNPFKFNRFIQDLLGYTDSELFSIGIQNLVHPDDIVAHDVLFNENKDKEFIIEQRFKNKTGHYVWVRVKTAPMMVDNRKFIIKMINDISDAKNIELQLRESAQQLKTHNEALEEFSYVISHDLQEPLRMISSFAQIIQKRYISKIDDSQAEVDFGYVIDGAKRMSTLIRDMLEYSRWSAKSLPIEQVDTDAVLDEVLQNLAVVINDNDAKIEILDIKNVNTNRLMLGQVFQNLIGNALKYKHPERAPHIIIGMKNREKDILFTVQDNGLGFDNKYSNRIFGIFQRLNSVKDGGNGMGLAICKRIIEKQGGTIWAESAENIGSLFSFTLPKVDINIPLIESNVENPARKFSNELAHISSSK